MKEALFLLLIVLVAAVGCLPIGPVTPSPSNQPPVAYIDSIEPAEVSVGEIVSFDGHGTDHDGTVVAYRWRSDIDGDLSTKASFRTSSLSAGSHTIYFKVQDSYGDWSDEVRSCIVVSGASPSPAEKPDLTIQNIWKVAGLTICYEIKNQGAVQAGASTSALVIDGVVKAYHVVAPLAAGASTTGCFGDYSHPSYPLADTIMVFGDEDNVVDESNERNNGACWVRERFLLR